MKYSCLLNCDTCSHITKNTQTCTTSFKKRTVVPVVIVVKKNSVSILFPLNCDKTHKLKLWQNFKKIKWWLNSKTQIVTELKNFNCDKTQKIKFWQYSKTQIVTKLKNTNTDKTQKLKLWQNSKNLIVTKLKNSNCDQIKKIKL